ncbi:MAG: HD family hydrolase [Candidatus Promineifilaceae bacterium]|nr:HD family hydrolase [Candidatus Promineifilaceae bacterium]
MDVESIVQMLLHGNQLKRTARTGWVQRGVPKSENVAEHSYGVAYATLILAELVDEAVDLGKALALAVLHDLAEGLTTDIPAPAWRFLPAGIKLDVERGAMDEILGETQFKEQFMDWWEDLHLNESAEARLVHDADKIDLYVQAMVYEQQTGNSHLEEFWTIAPRFHFPPAQAIYDALRARRAD